MSDIYSEQLRTCHPSGETSGVLHVTAQGTLRGIHVLISRALRTPEMHLIDAFTRESRTKKGNIQEIRAFDCIREC